MIAIIAILAAILFPVFARAREKARQASCSSNLKQLGTAMLMYVQDYDETLPGWGGYGNYWPDRIAGDFNWYAGNGLWNTWPSFIYPYVKNTQAFVCPSDSSPCYGVSYGMPADGIGPAPGYGRVDFYDRRLMLADIKRPAELCLIAEKDGGAPQYIMLQGYYACADRHNDGGNIAFIDGHVKWMKMPTGDIGYNFDSANSGYEVHVPAETIYDPTGGDSLN